MLRRLSRRPLQGRAQALPIAFTKERVGDDLRSGRGRTLLRLVFQCVARLFGRGIQALLFLLGA